LIRANEIGSSEAVLSFPAAEPSLVFEICLDSCRLIVRADCCLGDPKVCFLVSLATVSLATVSLAMASNFHAMC
jgi:hypothetical protein